jgi:AcrR family transcriptional regulator
MALVVAADELIREGGYSAVTSRTLAERLNLKRPIVHYYFRSMDDVFIEVVRRNSEIMAAKLEEAMAAKDPLRELVQINRDLDQAVLRMELNVLANRRPALKGLVARSAAELRALQTRVITIHFERRGITPGMPPIVVAVLVAALAQVLAVEGAIGISAGHAETLEFVDACLGAFAAGEEPPFATVAAPEATPSR